jgi:8-oxo-dGTP diphosphatase
LIDSEKFSADEHIHVVAALIWLPGSSDRLLISKRQKGKHLEEYWELPGGKIEPGESRRQALDRELREEINIVPVNASSFKQVSHRYQDRNILLDVWEVTSFRGDVKPREGQEVRWVAVGQLAEYQFPAADIPIIEAITNNATVKMGHLP